MFDVTLLLTILLMLFVNLLEAVTDQSCPQQPEVGKLGEEGAGILDTSGVGDVWYDMEEDYRAEQGDNNVSGRLD